MKAPNTLTEPFMWLAVVIVAMSAFSPLHAVIAVMGANVAFYAGVRAERRSKP